MIVVFIIKSSINSCFVYLLLCVDDMSIGGNMFGVEKLKNQLKKKFEIKILWMEIHENKQEGKLFLYQQKYIEKVLEIFDMLNVKLVKILITVCFGLQQIYSSD